MHYCLKNPIMIIIFIVSAFGCGKKSNSEQGSNHKSLQEIVGGYEMLLLPDDDSLSKECLQQSVQVIISMDEDNPDKAKMAGYHEGEPIISSEFNVYGEPVIYKRPGKISYYYFSIAASGELTVSYPESISTLLNEGDNSGLLLPVFNDDEGFVGGVEVVKGNFTEIEGNVFTGGVWAKWSGGEKTSCSGAWTIGF